MASSKNVQVPTISLAPFFSGNPEGKQKVVDQMRYACEEIGFFVIVDHQIPADIIETVWAKSREFFDLPIKDKLEVPMTQEYIYGYSGLGEEVLSKSQNVESGADLKETFQICIGPEKPDPEMITPRWPSKPDGFKEAWTAYYRALEKLAANLLRIFALALHLPENWFEDKIDQHMSALRALNYPEQKVPPLPGQLRASAHTDYGSLTILRQDNAPGGLQVLNKDNTWQDVKNQQDCFIINIGDLMSRWTNNKWVSTMHRVVNPPLQSNEPTRRQSMAFFHNINRNALVETISTCVSAEYPSKYPPIKAGDYLRTKHLSANYEKK